MQKRLVYDVGSHRGDDSHVYLRMGYRVVAVEANPALVAEMKVRFAKEISDGDLVVLNYAVAEKDNEVVCFFVDADTSKSSVRKMAGANQIRVEGQRLGSIMSKHGEPYYCKIDIEDADLTALKNLDRYRPHYLSVEVSGKSLREVEGQPDALYATLNYLHAIGYKKFKLVDQENFVVLTPASYYRQKKRLSGRIKTRLEQKLRLSPRDVFRRVFGLPSTAELSGYPGDRLSGKWVNYADALHLLSFHFGEYRSICQNSAFIFWVDIHAKL